MKNIFETFKEHKFKLTVFLILSPLSCILSILFALSLNSIIQAGAEGTISDLITAAAITLCLAGIDLIAALLAYKSRIKLIESATDSLRQYAMNGILSDRFKISEREENYYITLFSNTIPKIKSNCLESMLLIYENIFNFVLSMLTLILFSPWLGIFLFLIGLLSFYLPRLFEGRLKEKQRVQLESATEHMAILNDIVKGRQIIKNHCVEAHFNKKYQEASCKLENADFESIYLPYKVSWFSSHITSLAFVGIIVISAYLALEGQIAAAMILSISQLIGGVLLPLENIPMYISGLKAGKALTDELKSCAIREETESKLIDSPIEWKIIEINKLRFGYENQELLFDDISFSFKCGGKYVLMGQSGSGKSSFGRILAGLQGADFELKIDGKSVDASLLPRIISYMDQNVFLFRDTVYENISLHQNLSREKITDVLSQMNFCGRMDCENVLNISIGENGGTLSGGERQRIALLRELMGKKSFLILDEFNSALDPETAAKLEKDLLGLDNICCLFITHHVDDILLSKADSVMSLENGKINIIK